MSVYSIVKSDALEFLRSLAPDSVDLCFFSPPYTEARLYLEDGEDLGIARDAEEWSAWMVEIFRAAQACCKGLVACVCDGSTKDFKWNAAPLLLGADLHRAGFNLRKPPIFHRVGIPGSGGPDWFRGDTELIICTTRPGKLPWSDNTAHGHVPKWAPGGEMSHRQADGARRNKWGKSPKQVAGTSGHRKKDGSRDSMKRAGDGECLPVHKRIEHDDEGAVKGDHDRLLGLALANPGNVVEQRYFTASEVVEFLRMDTDYHHYIVGGGLMGEQSSLASENEAPFPEGLPERYVLSFCPPGGTVCDPFAGSCTTGAVAIRHGRNFVGCDLRPSQVRLGLKRLANETPKMLFAD